MRDLPSFYAIALPELSMQAQMRNKLHSLTAPVFEAAARKSHSDGCNGIKAAAIFRNLLRE